jgi:hypothetical protein
MGERNESTWRWNYASTNTRSFRRFGCKTGTRVLQGVKIQNFHLFSPIGEYQPLAALDCSWRFESRGAHSGNGTYWSNWSEIPVPRLAIRRDGRKTALRARRSTMPVPPALISTLTKCAFRFRRPLLQPERDWLQRWFAGTSYFSSHRRLSRGMARRLCHEMGAEVGTLRMPRGTRPVHDLLRIH